MPATRSRPLLPLVLLLALVAQLSACATWEDLDRMGQTLTQRFDHLQVTLRTMQTQLDAQSKRQHELSQHLEGLKGGLAKDVQEMRVELRAWQPDSLQELLARQVEETLSPVTHRLDQLPPLLGEVREVRKAVQGLTQSLLRAYRIEEAGLQHRLGSIGQAVRDLEGSAPPVEAIETMTPPIRQGEPAKAISR